MLLTEPTIVVNAPGAAGKDWLVDSEPNALGSVTPGEYCLMNDLFVVPAARGQGVGRALILHCLAYAQSRGFGAIEWQTALDNATAQRLYDSLPSERSGWYSYTLAAEGDGNV